MKVTIHDYEKKMPMIEAGRVGRGALEDWTEGELSRIANSNEISNSVVEVFNEAPDWENVLKLGDPESDVTSITIHFGREVNQTQIIQKNEKTYVIHAGMNVEGTSDYQEGIKMIGRLLKKVIEKEYYIDGKYIRREIKDYTKNTYEVLANELKEKVQSYEHKIIQAKADLTGFIRNHEKHKTDYERLTREDYNYADKIIAELVNLRGHPKIENVGFKDGLFIMNTYPLEIRDDVREKVYQGGSFEVRIGMNDADVRIESDLKRQGYWSGEDPHPHVNGADSTPCLGNVANSISELCGQNELYGLAMIVLSFLESANIHDSAGMHVTQWDEIDPDTKEVICEGHHPEDYDDGNLIHCEVCENASMHEEDAYSVDDTWMCESCYDEHTSNCEECGDRGFNDQMHYHINEDGNVCERCTDDMNYNEALGGYEYAE